VTAQAARPTTAARPGLVNGSRPPAPTFAHLIRLTDDTGLFEHARHAIVRRAHGYCTDDVARGLVVTSREPDPPPAVIRLAECYLAFLTHAQDSDGAFHNRLDFDRRWTDKPGLGDWWGRALWGLGTAVARSPAGWIREEALGAFTAGAARRSSAPHAMAFAGLGAAEVLRVRPDDDGAAGLLADAAEHFEHRWRPEPSSRVRPARWSTHSSSPRSWPATPRSALVSGSPRAAPYESSPPPERCAHGCAAMVRSNPAGPPTWFLETWSSCTPATSSRPTAD